ncbi:hypothetical protein J6Y73_05110 [bacterium]|nr:hypothetical protein [bacterium]
MKRCKSKLISAFVSLSLAFFITTLSVLFFTDYAIAWFSENKITKTNGIIIRTPDSSDVTTVSCHAFKYDGIYGAVCLDISHRTEVEMSEYDLIFTEKNINTPLFFRVAIIGVPDTTTGSLTITIPCSTPNYSISSNEIALDDGLYAQYYLSNLITCKIGCGLLSNDIRIVDDYIPVPTTSSTETSNLAIFNGVRDLMNAENIELYNVKTARYINDIVIDSNGIIQSAKKTTSVLSLTLNYDEYKDYLCNIVFDERDNIIAYDYSSEAVKDSLVFYIEFDYDDDLVNLFRNHTLENTLAKFKNDFGVITIQETR